MASIIEGYNYDIFISYRQKDNKGDRWVSEFVEALKTELESTFKEEISVYFDINPHDGLLETYDVDASLQDKLKCLIFIPIISRTYCDPQSFAWEHEFKAFIRQASQDQFGLKIKLPNGNVANRMIPVQIHDLYPEDKSLIEKELGGVLRAIEFNYKESGVNKPLTAFDNEKKNLNNTTYRIQINKVANAIDEIIHSLKGKQTIHVDRKLLTDQPLQNAEEDNCKELLQTAINNKKPGKLLLLGLSIVLCIFCAFAVFKIIQKNKRAKDIAKLEKSIAVLPFKLLSDEPDKQYLADGMMDAITLHLSKIKALRVLASLSVEQYRGTTKSPRTIGKELDVAYLLEGSFQKVGDNVKLIVQLIEANEQSHAWASEYNSKWSNVFSLQSEIAQKIASELNALLSPEEKQLIEKPSTTNLTAYDFYLRGLNELWKFGLSGIDLKSLIKSETLFKQAIQYDSTFGLAYVGLGYVYWRRTGLPENNSRNIVDSMLALATTALSYDDQLADAYYLRGGYYDMKGNTKKAVEEYDKAIRLNPNFWLAYSGKGSLFGLDLLSQIQNQVKAASLNHGQTLPDLLNSISTFFSLAGFPEKANHYCQEALKLTGDSVSYFEAIHRSEIITGNYSENPEFVEKIYSSDSNFVGRGRQVSLYIYAGQVWANGNKKETEYYADKQVVYCLKKINEADHGAADINEFYYILAGIYALRGEKGKAYENLRIFNKYEKSGWLLWVTLIKNDPFFNNIRNEPEFQQIVRDLESEYQVEHERVRKWLEEKGKL